MMAVTKKRYRRRYGAQRRLDQRRRRDLRAPTRARRAIQRRSPTSLLTGAWMALREGGGRSHRRRQRRLTRVVFPYQRRQLKPLPDERGGGGARMDAGLRVDVLEMLPHRARRDPQELGDLRIGLAS